MTNNAQQRIYKRKAIVLALMLAGVCSLAIGQTTTPVTTDTSGNTTVGPCAPTEGTGASDNFVACTQGGGTTSMGAYTANNIVVGGATIGVGGGGQYQQ